MSGLKKLASQVFPEKLKSFGRTAAAETAAAAETDRKQSLPVTRADLITHYDTRCTNQCA